MEGVFSPVANTERTPPNASANGKPNGFFHPKYENVFVFGVGKWRGN